MYSLLILGTDWMQDKRQPLPNPLHGCNDRGRDSLTINFPPIWSPQSSRSAAVPKHSCYPPASFTHKKRAEHFPAFNYLCRLTTGGGGEEGKSCQPDQGLKCKSPTSQAHFPLLFVGVEIREAIPSVLNPATSKGRKPHDVFLSVLLPHRFRRKLARKLKGEGGGSSAFSPAFVHASPPQALMETSYTMA